MQITLSQSEIEEALTDYVMSQVNIKAGMKVYVDLTATHGADGFTAIINIISPNKVIASMQVVDIPTVQEPAFDMPTPVDVPVVQQLTQEENKLAPVVESNPVKEAIAIATVPVAEVVVVPAPQAESVTPVRSLFAGLKRPVNTP
jgi:hypothetical protein